MRLCFPFFALWTVLWPALGIADEPKVVCYYGSWAVYRNGSGKMEISDIDPTLCTHLIFAFVGITENGDVRVLDPWVALPDNWGKAGFQKLNALRKTTAGLKTLVATGGWDEGSATYSKVMADTSLRSKYAKNVVDFVLRHEFDGFDIDWQYPNQRGGSPDDLQNYVLLLKELRESFDKHKLILSAAVGGSQILAELSYDIPQISKYLHFINLLLYDYHGVWDSTTGHCAPLFPAAREPTGLARSLNVNATVHYWLDRGAPAEKLVLGTGLYGISFSLNDSAKNAPGSPANGPGNGGPYTRQKGFLGYNEVCEITSQDSWTTVWDEEQRVPYAYAGDQWVSFENVRSVTQKAKYAKAMGLGGVMAWSIEMDDHKGVCGERYPLLNALNRVVRESASSSVSTSKTPTSVETADRTVFVTVASNGSADPDQEAKTTCARSNQKYVRHSLNCAKFWICQKIHENEFNAVPFTCGEGLYLDVNKKACRRKDLVQCGYKGG